MATQIDSPRISDALFRDINAPMKPHNGLGRLYEEIKPLGGSNSGFCLKHGMVVNVWPKQGVCLVLCAETNILKCTLRINSSSLKSGILDVSIPTIGDLVLVAKRDGGDHGVIVCAFPAWIQSLMVDEHTVDGLSSAVKDLSDAKTFDMEDFVFEGDQMGPILKDMLPGEKYTLNENLVGTIFSKYFFSAQAGEMCKFTMHYMDGLLEAFFHNMRMTTSGMSVESICDFGRTNTEILLSSNLKGWTGEADSATIRAFGGWLANGLHIYSTGAKQNTSDIWIDDLGTLAFRSLTSCFMQKVNGIYTPKRKFIPDHHDKNESDHSIYESGKRKAFSLFSHNGTDHPMAFGCKVRDYIAHLMSADYQFSRTRAYEKDWEFEKEGSAGSPPEISGFWGKPGERVKIETKIEDEADKNDAAVGDAFCGVLPDGSVLLRDAWGSQVELRGGRVVISGANDIEITSGSNVVVTAGSDVIIKGADHCEIISVDKDIRIRSGRMTMIDANKGGVQITALNHSGIETTESGEKYSTSGIVLKSKNVEVVADKMEVNLNDMLYIQGQEHNSPPLVLARCKNILTWTNGAIISKQGVEGDNYFVISQDASIMNTGGMYADKFVVGYEGLGTNGFAVAVDGGIYSNGMIGSDTMTFGRSLSESGFEEPIEPVKETDIVEKVQDSFEENEWDEEYRKPYKKEDYERIAYKHRTTEEYRTEDAKWFEKFWQRQYGGSPIDYSKDEDGDGEHSYPGKKHISGGKKDFVLYKEINVEKDGTPKKGLEDNDEKGGEFEEVPYSQQPLKKI
jgi:hypothetical protein